jgi:hypothetical protein
MPDGAPPPDEPVIKEDRFTVGIPEKGGSYYVEPTNSYDDSVTGYYLVTQDTSRVGATLVQYKGTNYPITQVYYFPETTSNGFPGSNFSNANVPLAANRTYFFDPGTYIDTDAQAYTRFSISNLSLVGLETDDGYPAAVITRLPFTGTNPGLERNILGQPNIYFENLIFDGRGNNMRADTSRGQYFFHISGNTGGFVAKDVVIRNIGSSNNINNRNVAINFLYTDLNGAASAGWRNLDNVRIENVRYATGYSIVAMNQTHDVYIRDLDLSNNPNPGTSSCPIKIEHLATTHIEGEDVKNIKNIVFDGKLILPTSVTGTFRSIYIQDYNYQVLLPSEYKYATCSTSNGGSNSSAIRVFNTLPTPATNAAILDLAAKYWYVTGTSPTVSNQLTYIGNVANIARNMTTVPDPRIKIAESGAVNNGFTVPDYWTRYNRFVKTYIVFLAAQPTTIYPALPHATGGGSGAEYVQYAASTANIVFSANNNLVSIYNVDFKTLANKTYIDALNGSNASFIHCLFRR